MANKVISWLEEIEDVFLNDSDDTDADPSYGDPVELRENESDIDISEPSPIVQLVQVRIGQKLLKPLVQEVIVL